MRLNKYLLTMILIYIVFNGGILAAVWCLFGWKVTAAGVSVVAATFVVWWVLETKRKP